MGQVSFLQSKGIVIEDMYYLPYLAEKYGTKKLVDMIAKGGDVNGMAMRTENTKDWLFDSPFDTEQGYIFIFPSDKGDFAVSGKMVLFQIHGKIYGGLNIGFNGLFCRIFPLIFLAGKRKKKKMKMKCVFDSP